jgi:5'-phosphate synthase pdxT subunit
MATEVLDALPDQETLGLMDVAVRRNAYGRQVDSFEADLDVHGLPGGTYRGVFIRAPWIERVGPDVDAIAHHDGHIVAARSGDLLATTFHPELTGDPRMHRFFLDEVVGS